jgi:hypothetical protein
MSKLRFSLGILLLLLLTACAAHAAPLTEIPAGATEVQPGSTATNLGGSIEATPTAEVFQGPDSGLSTQNAASLVMENGTWVTKNAEGKITASFNSSTQEWTYNDENIKQTQITLNLVPERTNFNISRDIPEEFKNPPQGTEENTLQMNGAPLEDGTVILTEQALVGQEGSFTLPTALIAARIVGVQEIQIAGTEVKSYVSYFNIRVRPDQNVLVVCFFQDVINIPLYSVPSGDVTNISLRQADPEHADFVGLDAPEFAQELLSGKWRGQQVLLLLPYNFPEGNRQYDENGWRKALVESFKRHTLPQQPAASLGFTGIGTSFVVPLELLP